MNLVSPMNLKKLRTFLNKKQAQKEYIQNEIQSLEISIKKQKVLLLQEQRALEFIKEIAIQTQGQLEFQLGDMVSTGLNTVFDQAYEFLVKFELRRDKTECDLFFKKQEELVDPLLFSGLGAADVAAFALRCASWSMVKKSRNTLLLDEPFKHLSVNHHERVGALVKMLSEKLGLQIIMITHSEIMSRYADKIYKVTMQNNVSKVHQVKDLLY